MPRTPEQRIEDLERRVRELEEKIGQVPGMIHSTEKTLNERIESISMSKPPLGTRLPSRKSESLSAIAKRKGGKLY
jgi:hypothetical protein